MSSKNLATGYVVTRKINGSLIPQKVQNIVIRDYATKNGLKIGLSYTELLSEKLENALCELTTLDNNKVIFYSIEIFTFKNFKQLSKLIEQNISVDFALEEIKISKPEDLDELGELYWLRKITNNTSLGYKIPFADLSFTEEARKNILADIDSALSSGRLLNSNYVEEFEMEIKEYLPSGSYPLGVSSGTGALVLALMSMGVERGDEVIVPCVSWVSSAHAISFVGAKPVFVDVNKDLSMNYLSCEKSITKRTKAIMLVHFLGKISSEYEKIANLARVNNLKLIEDCSQAFGASKGAIQVGALGDVSCFSLNPMKCFGAAGNAGLISVKEKETLERLRRLRYCGLINKKESSEVSLNFRLNTFQAVVLRENLKSFDAKRSFLKSLNDLYRKGLGGVVELMPIDDNENFAYYGFTIFTENREELMRYLDEVGVETKIQHEPLMSEQVVYKDSSDDMIIGKQRVKEVLSLPLHEKMTQENVLFITHHIKEFLS